MAAVPDLWARGALAIVDPAHPEESAQPCGCLVGGPMVTLDELMTPAEVAAAFRVDPKTVARWAVAGKLPSTRTPGGHRRYRRADVARLLGRAG